MEGPDDFLVRFGREAIAEMAILDREHQNGLDHTEDDEERAHEPTG